MMQVLGEDGGQRYNPTTVYWAIGDNRLTYLVTKFSTEMSQKVRDTERYCINIQLCVCVCVCAYD